MVAIPAEQFRVSSERVEQARTSLTEPPTTRKEDQYLAIFKTQGFFELPEDEGDLLAALLQGPTMYSVAARSDMTNLLTQSNYGQLPYWHQVMVLSGFLRGWHSEQTSRGPVTRRAEYAVSDPQPTNYSGWHGARRTGFRSDLTIGGSHHVTLFTPAADSPERDSAPKAVAGLPPALYQLIRIVTVEPYGTANEFNSGGGQMWIRLGRPATLGVLDNVIAHEVGHQLMNRTDCYLPWQEAMGKDILSTSHYGRLNPSEDFAEFVRLYLSTKNDPEAIESLSKLFPHRMEVLNANLKKVEFTW
jgi:hypothetical protein